MEKLNSIYLDYQASTPTNRRVVEKMLPFFAETYGNPHSSDHVFGWQANQAVQDAQADLATFLGADYDEVLFTSGATESNNHAILGSIAASRGTLRNRVIVSAVEHKCVLAAAQASVNLFGTELLIAPVDSCGRLDLNWLEANTDDRVAVVSMIGVNNEIGTVQDFSAIAEIVQRCGAIFHTDCAQAPLAIEMTDIVPHVDLISLSGHKMYGPKGIGALYIRRTVQDRVTPLMYGGGQQNNIRSGTVPTPLAVGLGEASRLLTEEDRPHERARLATLRAKFIEGLTSRGLEIDVVTPVDTVSTHPGNANIRFSGIDAHELIQRLQPVVAASTGSACASGEIGASHVLRAIGLEEQDAEQCVRFSLGSGTTLADIDQAIDHIATTLTSDVEDIGLEFG